MIQQMSEQDVQRTCLPLMAEIEAGSWFHADDSEHVTWLRRCVSRRVGRGGVFYVLAEDDAAPLGLSCLVIDDYPVREGHAEVLDLVIVASHRRKGYGTLLIRDAVRRCREAGLCCIYVSTYAGDADAISFYQHVGFRSVAELPRLNGPTDRGQLFLRMDLP
jgi:GNAT superfamily N-acetyltransferase